MDELPLGNLLFLKVLYLILSFMSKNFKEIA
jgi:hypothetical protein